MLNEGIGSADDVVHSQRGIQCSVGQAHRTSQILYASTVHTHENITQE